MHYHYHYHYLISLYQTLSRARLREAPFKPYCWGTGRGIRCTGIPFGVGSLLSFSCYRNKDKIKQCVYFYPQNSLLTLTNIDCSLGSLWWIRQKDFRPARDLPGDWPKLSVMAATHSLTSKILKLFPREKPSDFSEQALVSIPTSNL